MRSAYRTNERTTLLVRIRPGRMETLAFRPRLGGKTLLPLVLALSGLSSYACDGGEEPGDADGIGGQDGSDIIVMPPSGGSTSSGGTGSGGTATDDKPPFEACSLPGQGTTPEDALLLDDFEDGDAQILGNGLHGNWYAYDDMTDGSQTPSWDESTGWLPEVGGIDEDGFALHAVGSGYTEWGSGQGMSFIWDASKSQECLFDATNFDGVSFWIKGEVDGSESAAIEADRGVIKLGFQEVDVVPQALGGECDEDEGSCYDWHKVRITPTECWQRISIPFEDFAQDDWGVDGGELDLDKILNFNLEIAQGHSYDYWLDDLELWSGEQPEAEEICDDGIGGAGGEGGGGP